MRTGWMCWVGRLLATALAGFGSFVAVAGSFGTGTAWQEGFLPVLATVLVLIGSAYIAWRWEVIGGMLLLSEGTIAWASYSLFYARSADQSAQVLLSLGVLSLLAGMLLLADYRLTHTHKPT